MQPILTRLPDPSSLDTQFTEVLKSFSDLSTKAEEFSPADLTSVLKDGQKLPIPDSLGLIGDTLNKLSQMSQIIPSDPERLTALLQEGLEKLIEEVTGLKEIFEPLTKTTDFIAPLLEKFTFLSEMVTHFNNIITLLRNKTSGLNLKDIPEQFKYISNLFDIFPDAAKETPFKELKAQIDTIKTWLTMNSEDLTGHFRSQIQTMADALPTQLNDVMQAGLDALKVIEDLLPSLDRNAWYDSYNAALDEVASLDPGDLSHINDYIALMENKVTQVKAVIDNLTQKALDILEGLEVSDIDLFSQDLRDALMNIIDTIAPEKPGILAVMLHRTRMAIGGFDVSTINSIVEQVGQEMDKLIGNMGISEVIDRIKDITNRIVSTVGMVDKALVEVALTLSNLMNELKGIISNVDMNGMVEGIKNAFGGLEDLTESLVNTVNGITKENGVIHNFIKGVKVDIEKLDIDKVKGAINGLLSKITAVLDDPEIQHILNEVHKTMEEISQNLEGVTLKPVFDQVVEEIGDLKKKLAAVDISELNDFLKVALKTALEVIRKIDFASEVAEELEEQFKAILDQSLNLIKPIQEKYKEIDTIINRFNPGAIVSNHMASPFEEMVESLDKIKPSVILSPLKSLQESLQDQFDPFSPETLFAPLSELHLQLVNALKSLSPHDILKPLNELLGKVTGLLDKIGIEDLITKISESVNKINDLMSSFLSEDQIQKTDFWGILEKIQLQGSNILTDIESNLNKFLDQIMTYIPDINMSILQGPLDGMRASISTIKNHINSPEALKRIDTMINHLNTQDFNGCITDLSQKWLAQKARFEQITPPPELAEQYEILKKHLSDLSPIVALAKPANLVDQIRTGLGMAQMELARTKKELLRLLTENLDKLDALLPDEPTNEGFKKLLRETLVNQIIKPIQEILIVLKDRFQEFCGIFEGIKIVALKLKAPFEALTIIPKSISDISNALIDAKDKIKKINLNFLEDELQGVLDEVINKIDTALKPSSFLSPIQTCYEKVLDAIKGLYPESLILGKGLDPESEFLGLDPIYIKIQNTISELHPDKTVAQPLNKTYQDIIKKMNVFNVDRIFEVLNKKLDTINQELEVGLDRAEKAFNELLSAMPTIPAGVGI